MPAELKSEFLFSMDAELNPPDVAGPGPLGMRMIAIVKGGRFEGPGLSGELLPGGGDWALMRADGVLQIDVRATLRSDDGAVIYASYGGRMDIPAELQPKVFDRTQAESVDPSAYYFRTCPLFETGAEKYAWLNRIQAVGIGRLTSRGVAYDVHRIL